MGFEGHVLNTKFSGGLFREVNSYFGGTDTTNFWVDCLAMDGDGQTVFDFAGTGATKFSGGLFRGVNSYFGGTRTAILLVGCFAVGGEGQTVLILAGTGTTKFPGGLF